MTPDPVSVAGSPERFQAIRRELEDEVYQRTDRQFAGLLIFQWVAGIVAASLLSPLTWTGSRGILHPHVWAATVLGALIVSLPLLLVAFRPGQPLTRHAIAVAQMAMGALFIHLSGGRIETHFHVFGSLAFLAIYRDWRVIVTGTLVVAADHLLCGFFWPESIYNVALAAPGRTLEHIGWVAFTDVFLLIGIHQSCRDMASVARKRAALERVNGEVEARVLARTADLQASQERIRAILDSAHDAFVGVDQAGAIMEWNPRAGEMFGWTEAEAAGRPLDETIVVEAQRSQMRQLTEGCLGGGDKEPRLRKSLEFSCLRRHGGEFPVELTIWASHRSGEHRFYLFIRDITERKKTEDAMRLQQNELRLLFDYMPAMVCFKDTENRILRANHQLAQAIGKPVEEIEGRPTEEIYPEEAAKFYADDQEVIRSGVPKLGIVESFCDRAGRQYWIETHKVPVHDQQGKVAGIIAMAQDITERKQTDEALRESEQRFSGAFEYAPIGVSLLSLGGRWLKVNRALCEMVGYTEDELLGGSFQDITHPDDVSSDLENLRQMNRGEKNTYRCEKRYVHAQGHTVTVLLNVSVVRNRQGRPVYFVAQTQDISERKRAEILLLESERKFRLLSDNITDVFWIFSPDFQTVHYISKGYERIWGRPMESLQAHPQQWSEAILPEDREQAMAAVARLMGDETDVSVEYRIARPDGSVRWVLARGFQVRDAAGVLQQLTGTVSDVTERKESEESLRLLGSALEQSKESIMITDAQLELPGPRIVFVNAAFTTMTGYSLEDVIGKTPRITQGPRTDRVVTARLRQTLEQGGTFHGTTINYRKDGIPFDLEWQVAPVRNARGVVTNYVAVHRDITARKAAELELLSAREEALESVRLKSRFLANMSHELRTPLNTINGLSATLVEQDLAPEAKQAAALILQCGESLLENIQTILTHSSLEAGKTKLDAKPFNLLGVVMNAVHITGEATRRKGISLDYYLDPRLPAELVGDPFRLQQILVNLLANGIKFTDRGRVYLRVRGQVQPDGQWIVRVAVADTGVGIAKETVAKLFKPFSQADDSNTRRFEGTGLGLSIAKSLVELMGGQISVSSRVGLGSVFHCTVRLPAVAGTPRVFAESAHPMLAGKRLLIVEPDGVRRRLLQTLGEAWQLRTCAAESTMAALPGEFDFAVQSIETLPANAGPAVAIPSPAMPVVWLDSTGGPSPKGAARRGASLGVPFSPAELSQALVSLLTKEAGAASEQASPPVAAKMGDRLPLRILAADDTRTNREGLKLLCGHLGYAIDLVENGAQALQRLETNRYDLLLLDVQMPVLDGLAAAREIHRIYPDPKQRPRLVAVTASVLPGDRERCLEAGMDEYLVKPMLPKHLIACIERLFINHAASPARSGGSAQPFGERPASWLDHAYLKVITEGLDATAAVEFIAQIYAAAEGDFAAHRPLIAEACALRQAPQLATHVHGLKGCALSLGWRPMAERCAEVLKAVRENRFDGWTGFPGELNDLHDKSAAELESWLAESARAA